jgi:hypothetical protein
VRSYLLPCLERRPVATITAQELLGVLRRVEVRGAMRRRIACSRSLDGCCGLPWRREAQRMMSHRISRTQSRPSHPVTLHRLLIRRKWGSCFGQSMDIQDNQSLQWQSE